VVGYLWIAIVAACGRSVPSDAKDCEGLAKGDRADECWAAVIPTLARTDPDLAVKVAEERVTDDQTRDFLYLQITREVDPGNARWCNRIRERIVQERCAVLVRRPHLHRALGVEAAKAAGGPNAVPGAPPPGAPTATGAPPGGAPPGGAPPYEPPGR
jgi:hypothetical protein